MARARQSGGPWYLGIDIGGTKTAVCLGRPTPAGWFIAGRRQFATADTAAADARDAGSLARLDPMSAVERIATTAAQLLAAVAGQSQGQGASPGTDASDTTAVDAAAHAVAHAGSAADTRADADRCVAFGVACGGPLDARRGIIMAPPNLPGWDAVPIVDVLSQRLGMPGRLMNDADAGALAEHQCGAGRGCHNVVFLTFGTGIGAGLILNNLLYAGASGGAGEIGHVRLAETGPVGYHKAGSVEGFCSGGGIARLAAAAGLFAADARQTDARQTDARQTDARRVFTAAAAGDRAAQAVVSTVADKLGSALAILIDILNPQVIVLGGIFPRAEALIRPGMQRALERECLAANLAACRVVPSALGERIGDYAALTIAKEAYHATDC